MILFDWELKAGQVNPWWGTGRYLRILSGNGDLEIQAIYNGGASQSSKIIAGIGVNLSDPESGDPFRGIYFTSPTDQTIRVLVTHLESTDSRLAGDVDVNGVLSVVNAGGLFRSHSKITMVANVPTKILDADVSRLKAALNFSAPVVLGADNAVTLADGFPLSANSDWIDENVNELWALSASACDVRIIQDKK